MDNDWIDNDEDINDSNNCELSKNEVIKLLLSQDTQIDLIAPKKFKSPIWERFRLVYFRGTKLDFVQCTGCSLVLVYKSKTGTASLLRHRCAKFPISVYDLKLAAAGHPIDLLSSMDNSSGNSETIEMKQEMLSDDECLDLQDIHDDNDQQFTNDQTNKGLMVSFSLLERSLVTGDDSLLTREEIVAAQRTNDPELYFERPRNHRHSSTWDRFEIVFYRNIRQNFAKCLSCNSIVSYKKTTGTASLIRHKCKGSRDHQQAQQHPQHQQPQQHPIKSDSVDKQLINLLTQTKQPPALTPAPVVQYADAPSSSSAAVSSTANVKQQIYMKISENTSLLEVARRNIALSQIKFFSQSLITTEILSDPTYTTFLQKLVDFGAEFGKQNVSNIVNRNLIGLQMIPKKCENLQLELMNILKETEFTISYHEWNTLRDERYVTVFGYFFTNEFAYKTQILGTRKCEDEEDVISVVKEISECYKTTKDSKLKCISDAGEEDFENFPCIVGQITNVILNAFQTNTDSMKLFSTIYKKAHEILSLPYGKSFDNANNTHRLKILYEFHQHLKMNDDSFTDQTIEKFRKLFGALFSAISSLTETSDDGAPCVTANKVYLWFKKLVKQYNSMKGDDDVAAVILKKIEEIKLHEIYQIAVFLDPNFKNLKFLDVSDRTTLLDIVKRSLRRMMSDEDSMDGPPTKKTKVDSQSKSYVNDTFLEFMDITMESIDDQVNSEIQCYMGFKLDNPVDIVDFWRDTDCFPYLKKLAANYLNLPSCTFHSNCCFLSTGHELYLKCQNLSGDDIETLTFLHQSF